MDMYRILQFQTYIKIYAIIFKLNSLWCIIIKLDINGSIVIKHQIACQYQEGPNYAYIKYGYKHGQNA